MTTFAKFSILGVLGQNPEIVTSNNGSVVKLSLCITKKFKKNGEITEKSYWFNAVSYNEKQFEYLTKYFQKGNRVLISGEMFTHTWVKDDVNIKEIVLKMDEIIQTSQTVEPKKRTTKKASK